MQMAWPVMKALQEYKAPVVVSRSSIFSLRNGKDSSNEWKNVESKRNGGDASVKRSPFVREKERQREKKCQTS